MDRAERSLGSTDAPAIQPAIGLALAGGAAEGAIYEIGALRALDEALVGIDLNELGIYVGVSAGGFLASNLANGLSSAQMCRAIVKPEPGEHPFVPEMFFRPAVRHIGRSILRAPGLLAGALRDFATGRERRLADALTSVGQSLPVALFDNEPIRAYIERIFSIKGRTDDFRRLKRQLAVVSTDIESGEAQVFGHGGWTHVPISRAVQATTALPGLYPPVPIDGRWFVDGVLLKTMHASVALDAGAKLVFCINPVVPVDLRRATQQNHLRAGHLIDSGLTSVLSQTVRTMIHSRMSLGIRAYARRYPDADVVLIEPPRDDVENFFSNIFSFSSRRAVAERAYHSTRRTLLQQKDRLIPLLERHGLSLDVEFLEAEDADLWRRCGAPSISSPDGRDHYVVSDLDGLLDRIEALAGRVGGASARGSGHVSDEIEEVVTGREADVNTGLPVF